MTLTTRPFGVVGVPSQHAFYSRVCMRSFSRCADGSGARVDAFELALKQWCNYVPAMEFRCFVRNHDLIGPSCGGSATFSST